MSTEDERPVEVTAGEDTGRATISEYWPDLPHRITPAPDYFRAVAPLPAAARNRPTVPLPPVGGPNRRFRRRWMVWAAIVLLILVAAAVIVVDRRQREPSLPATGAPPAGESAAPFRITGAADGRDTAVLVLGSDVSAVRIRAGATDGDLYRASSPRGGSVRPVASITGDTVLLELIETGGSGAGALDVQLSADVRWSVRVDAAINNADVDVSRTGVDDVRWAGDAADVTLRLPQPQGFLTVTVTGGVNRFRVAAPADTPVRVRAGGGLGRADIDGTIQRGVARGERFETDGWGPAADKVDVNAQVGLGEIKVERY